MKVIWKSSTERKGITKEAYGKWSVMRRKFQKFIIESNGVLKKLGLEKKKTLTIFYADVSVNNMLQRKYHHVCP